MWRRGEASSKEEVLGRVSRGCRKQQESELSRGGGWSGRLTMSWHRTYQLGHGQGWGWSLSWLGEGLRPTCPSMFLWS